MTATTSVFGEAMPLRHAVNLMTARNAGEADLFVKAGLSCICGVRFFEDERVSAGRADKLDVSATIIDSKIVVTKKKHARM